MKSLPSKQIKLNICKHRSFWGKPGSCLMVIRGVTNHLCRYYTENTLSLITKN